MKFSQILAPLAPVLGAVLAPVTGGASLVLGASIGAAAKSKNDNDAAKRAAQDAADQQAAQVKAIQDAENKAAIEKAQQEAAAKNNYSSGLLNYGLPGTLATQSTYEAPKMVQTYQTTNWPLIAAVAGCIILVIVLVMKRRK